MGNSRVVAVAPERLSKWLDGFAERHGALRTEATDASVTVTAADGAVAEIEVPFPPLADFTSRPLTALQVHVTRPRRVGVLLVRRGGYAAGVFQGRELMSSKVGSAYVQGTTKKGGSSQQRYARRRANQARASFQDAADVAVRVLLPESGGLEALFCGGDRPALAEVLADSRLAPLGALRQGRLLEVPDPRLRVLQATPDQFLAVRIRLTEPQVSATPER